MIVSEVCGNVVTSDGINQNLFRIKASRKAFEILSAGLYSDKVKAIIRELSTNAADSHKAAGNSAPFEVHLPNSLEPWFAVKDYGTGMSHEAVNTLYTTYFESDKDRSNDFTGALGLGSKSPFSYTDSFTVESRQHGVERTYNAYLNSDGVPAISFLNETTTDDKDGITVKFPVKSGDFYEFHKKSEEVLQWFSVRPSVGGVHNFTYPTREYLVETEEFAVCKKRELYSQSSYVVMGNIAYPISSSDFTDRKLQSLIEWGVILRVNIGDVEINASREKLSYDKKTIELIKSLLNKALIVLSIKVTESISSKPSLWEARQELNRVKGSFKGFEFEAKWGGKEIDDFVKKQFREDEETKTVISSGSIERLRVKNFAGDRLTVKRSDTDVVFADGTVIFLNDERGAYSAIRRYLENKPQNTVVYMISNYSEDWVKSTGIADVAIRTSTLPKVMRDRTTRETDKSKFYKFVPNQNGNASSHWNAVDVDIDEGGVYVEIAYFNCKLTDEKTISPSNLNYVLRILGVFNRSVKIYGVRSVDVGRLTKSDGDWVSLWEYLHDLLRDRQDLEPALIMTKEMGLVTPTYRHRVPFFDFKPGDFSPNSLFGSFVTQCQKACNYSKNPQVNAYEELRQFLGISMGTDNFDRLSLLRERVYERYPMLKFVERPYEPEFVKTVVNYVKGIDNQ